jgi:Tat protein translocase TatB subunit
LIGARVLYFAAMFGIGMAELMVILVVALLFLGPEKLPDAAKKLSRGLREFRQHGRELQKTLQDDTELGAAVRDLKSALRGEEYPPVPYRRERKEGESAPAGDQPPAGDPYGLRDEEDERESDGEQRADGSPTPAPAPASASGGDADAPAAAESDEEAPAPASAPVEVESSRRRGGDPDR